MDVLDQGTDSKKCHPIAYEEKSHTITEVLTIMSNTGHH